MKVAERKRASPVKRSFRTAFSRGRSWLLIGVLLLLPIGIGISIRQARNTDSGRKQQRGREKPPAREEQIKATTVEAATDAEKAIGNPAARAITADHFPAELHNKSPVPAEAGRHARDSSRLFPSPNDALVISKITPSLVPSPMYELRAGPEKRFQPRNWFEVEVEFSVRKPVPDGAVFRFRVMIADVVFTGDIPVGPLEKGEDLVTVAYISPNSLWRAFHGRSSVYSVLHIEISIVSGEETIGGDVFETEKGTFPIFRTLEETVWPKSNTPFAPLYWDRYVEPVTEPPSKGSGNSR
jgi:hypothetical protein